MSSHVLNVKKINLTDGLLEIEKVDSHLASIIKEWMPPANFKLYLARYSYGSEILSQGQLQLPLANGASISFDDVNIPPEMVNDLSYSSFPVGLILNNTAEVFIELNRRLVSLALFSRGIPLGLLETLENRELFCFKNRWVTAGARTAFMLPKISDKVNHKKIQRAIGCSSEAPQTQFDHVPVFIDIADKLGVKNDWYVDVLFFSSAWFEEDDKNIHWLRFHHYLQKVLLDYTGFSRNKVTFDLIWDGFSTAITQINKRVESGIYEKMKILVMGALSVTPLFAVATDNSSAPIEQIQKVYREIYELPYAPAIMIPHHFILGENTKPVYYSLTCNELYVNQYTHRA